MNAPYDRVTAALKAHGSRNNNGKNWQCPAHDDRNPSLSVNRALHTGTGEATVLLHCHAGCSVDEVLEALGLEPAHLFTGNGNGRQGELFPKSKYSPVGVEILAKLPPGPERSFIVASALGRFVDRYGGRTKVQSRQATTAVIVEAKHRRAVVETLGIAASTLRKHIMSWTSWGVAHRCSNTVLTIFIRSGAECPVCGAFQNRNTPPIEACQNRNTETPETFQNRNASQRETELTDDGFFKGVDGTSEESLLKDAKGAASDDDPNAGLRRFKQYPGLIAVEREYRRRKAGEKRRGD